MARNSDIEWPHHSFNPWTGCTKLSPACDNCYAESWSKRSAHVEWGPHGARRRTKTWHNPVNWNMALNGTGRRERVFCASLADIFDNHRSIQPEWREDLWDLIDATPNLDWLLLTKRPQNVARFAPDRWFNHGWPAHVWLGTTVENQDEAERRIPHLLTVPAKVRFLSCEPLLGPVDLHAIKTFQFPQAEQINALRGHKHDFLGCATGEILKLHWVIAGGESGPGARPAHPEWIRSLRDQCESADVPFFFKQWGNGCPVNSARHPISISRTGPGWMQTACRTSM